MFPKKGGFTVIRNEKNELIPTRTMTRWMECIDYRKWNTTTKKDQYPFPFIDQMLTGWQDTLISILLMDTLDIIRLS